jgi:hypothetical protein
MRRMKMKYEVKFGMARAYYTPELHENTRTKIFNNKNKAEDCLERLQNFGFKDSVFSEFNLIAWTELNKINLKENEDE